MIRTFGCFYRLDDRFPAFLIAREDVDLMAFVREGARHLNHIDNLTPFSASNLTLR